MGQVTAKETSTLTRQVFSPVGILQGDFSHGVVQSANFLKLVNCYIDKRIGAVLKRDGSETESINTGLGIPLILGENERPVPGAGLPSEITAIANFSGSFYRKDSGTWAAMNSQPDTFFSTSRPGQMVQLGLRTWIAGGRLAYFDPRLTAIHRAGLFKPTQAITTSLQVVTGGAPSIEAVAGYKYMYTYYNNTTDLESDWAPLSTDTGPFPQRKVVLTIPTDSPAPADSTHKRIYRTLDGGGVPFLLATISVDTTAYTDTTPDAQLSLAATRRFKKALPPEDCYLLGKHANRLWTVESDNSYIIKYSESYTGVESDLELWPTQNFVVSNDPVTGFLTLPGKMLVFHPRGISYISGSTPDDFVFQPFRPGIGTVFPNSIATDGSRVICLSEKGWADITAQKPLISREINEFIQPLLHTSYNSRIYVSAIFNPSIRQFITCIAGISTEFAQWEEVGTGIIRQWEEVGTSIIKEWGYASGSGEGILRSQIWGWSPDLSDESNNRWQEYTFPGMGDHNEDGAFPVLFFHPRPSASDNKPQQDVSYLGYFDGTEGKILGCFRKDKSQDDGSDIESTILTAPLRVGDESVEYKYYRGLQFYGPYSDPTSDSNATLQYLIDFEDPHLRNFIPQLVALADNSRDIKRFPRGKARYIHLYITDVSASQSKILLGQFYIWYRERHRRGNR